jgi:N-acetylmuramoyl-L-alanine amidase
MDETPDTLLTRFRKAKDRRVTWENHWQFSCWNQGDPNRAKILALDENDPRLRACLRVARRALAGEIEDATGGATHYHTRGMTPPWARNREPSAEIGRHLFYNDIE